MNKKIISLGGSIVCPEKIDTQFLIEFRDCLTQWLCQDQERQIYLVVGGGSLAREYQDAYKKTTTTYTTDKLDRLGINATHLNAQLIHALCSSSLSSQYWQDYETLPHKLTQLVVMGGWKPGFSTDFCAVSLAEKLSIKKVINLSNIAKLYSADPKLDPHAQAIDKINWEDFQKIIGEDWQPGGNYPFDPIASLKSKELGLSVIIANGRNTANLFKILNDEDFTGSLIES